MHLLGSGLFGFLILVRSDKDPDPLGRARGVRLRHPYLGLVTYKLADIHPCRKDYDTCSKFILQRDDEWRSVNLPAAERRNSRSAGLDPSALPQGPVLNRFFQIALHVGSLWTLLRPHLISYLASVVRVSEPEFSLSSQFPDGHDQVILTVPGPMSDTPERWQASGTKHLYH